MRKLSILAVLTLVLIIAAGCGNANKASSTVKSTAGAMAGQNGGQMMQSPEGKLARAIMSISRIQRSENPLTKEQTQKLITIINDVKAKDLIDETYANQKIAEINAIPTEQQKQMMSPGQGNFNRNRNNGNAPQNPNSNGQQPQNMQRNGQSNGNFGGGNRGNGGSGNGVNGNSVDIKSICDRVIADLQK